MAKFKYVFIYFAIFATYVTSSPLSDSCTVTNYNDVATAAANCDTLTLKDIEIPKETTMVIKLKDGAKLIFDGRITHVPAEWTGDLIKITGNNVDISGTSAHLLDGLGPKHWKGGDEKTITRPKFLRLQVHKTSQIKNLHLKNCPNNCIMIQSSDTVIANILVDNRDGYPATAGSKYAKNTDGFDVGSSTNLRIKNSIVYNQDDCVAVNGGSNLLFDNLWCNGSHGFSFSVRDGDVHDVEFRNSHIEYSDNAIHIKTHNDGTTGTIRNVLYHNITFKDIQRYAISVQQNYPSGAAKGNIPITNLTMNTVTGTMSGKKSVAKQIVCASGACSGWTWTNVQISGAKNGDECQNVPSGISC